MVKRNRTLKDILDLILYENPSTQDEIAEKLGITRRYVTQLLQPLVKNGTVKRAYMIDLNSYRELYDSFGGGVNLKDQSGDFLINEILINMTTHVRNQLDESFNSIVENDKEKAENALEMDYTTNYMLEKVRTSVETIVSINQHSEFPKSLVFNEVAYNLERIGDYCGHIAKFTVNDVYDIDEEVLIYLQKMHKNAQKMIKYSMETFIEGKLELNDEIMDLEEMIHELQNKALNYIAVQMAETSFEDKERSNYFIYLSRVIKAFERIGDITIEIMDISAEVYKNIPRTTTPRTFR